MHLYIKPLEPFEVGGNKWNRVGEQFQFDFGADSVGFPYWKMLAESPTNEIRMLFQCIWFVGLLKDMLIRLLAVPGQY